MCFCSVGLLANELAVCLVFFKPKANGWFRSGFHVARLAGTMRLTECVAATPSSQKVDETPSSRENPATPFGGRDDAGDEASPAPSATGASQLRVGRRGRVERHKTISRFRRLAFFCLRLGNSGKPCWFCLPGFCAIPTNVSLSSDAIFRKRAASTRRPACLIMSSYFPLTATRRRKPPASVLV